MRAASTRARFAKRKSFALQPNTIRDLDGRPFMTSSAKTRLPLDKMLQEVRPLHFYRVKKNFLFGIFLFEFFIFCFFCLKNRYLLSSFCIKQKLVLIIVLVRLTPTCSIYFLRRGYF